MVIWCLKDFFRLIVLLLIYFVYIVIEMWNFFEGFFVGFEMNLLVFFVLILLFGLWSWLLKFMF